MGHAIDQQTLQRPFWEIIPVEAQGHSLIHWIPPLPVGSWLLTAFSMWWCFQGSRPGYGMENLTLRLGANGMRSQSGLLGCSESRSLLGRSMEATEEPLRFPRVPHAWNQLSEILMSWSHSWSPFCLGTFPGEAAETSGKGNSLWNWTTWAQNPALLFLPWDLVASSCHICKMGITIVPPS